MLGDRNNIDNNNENKNDSYVVCGTLPGPFHMVSYIILKHYKNYINIPTSQMRRMRLKDS